MKLDTKFYLIVKLYFTIYNLPNIKYDRVTSMSYGFLIELFIYEYINVNIKTVKKKNNNIH
jgi:hypothetical protein